VLLFRVDLWNRSKNLLYLLYLIRVCQRINLSQTFIKSPVWKFNRQLVHHIRRLILWNKLSLTSQILKHITKYLRISINIDHFTNIQTLLICLFLNERSHLRPLDRSKQRKSCLEYLTTDAQLYDITLHVLLNWHFHCFAFGKFLGWIIVDCLRELLTFLSWLFGFGRHWDYWGERPELGIKFIDFVILLLKENGVKGQLIILILRNYRLIILSINCISQFLNQNIYFSRYLSHFCITICLQVFELPVLIVFDLLLQFLLCSFVLVQNFLNEVFDGTCHIIIFLINFKLQLLCIL